jgi:hypothetical protein
MLGDRKITTATLARESLEGSVARGCLQGVVLWLKGPVRMPALHCDRQMKYVS